jgi:arylsulfatase A-like enzyme
MIDEVMSPRDAADGRSGSRHESRRPPNVLLITADQWRADSLSAVGHPCVRTPAVDALAAEGTLFRRHYCQAAPCSPARASLYTGLYQMTHRVCTNGTPLDSRFDNIAKAARRAGYDPVLYGYTDQSIDPSTVPANDPRLTTYEGILPGFRVGLQLDEAGAPWLDWLRAKGIDGTSDFASAFLPADWKGEDSRLGPGLRPPRFADGETLAAFLTGKVVEMIEGERDRPWFAHASFLAPHPPFGVPEPWLSMVAPEKTPRPIRRERVRDEADQHPFLAHKLDRIARRNFVVGAADGLARDWSLDEVAILRAIYYGMIAEVDSQIGRIAAALRRTGVYDDTIIVVTTDHGEMLGDHHLFGKLGYFDQSFHIPLVIKAPGLGGGHVVDRFTEAVDVLPTILDLIGADLPDQIDGAPLTPFLAGSMPATWRSEAHWEYDFRDVATAEAEHALDLPLDACALSVLRGHRYKYVHFTGLPPLLFDLERDPGEFENRVADPDYRDVVIDCAQRMLSWRMAHADRRFSGTALTANGPVSRPPLHRARTALF